MLYFCSSLASVLNSPPSIASIAEQPSNDPNTASGIGYSQSKWVTEQVCVRAIEALSGVEAKGQGGRVTILRVGQLCGDTIHGRWNEKEGWPLLIRTAEEVGCLPELDEVSHSNRRERPGVPTYTENMVPSIERGIGRWAGR